MNLQEFNNLADDPGNVSWGVKGIALALVFGIILFLGYKLVIVDEIDGLAGVEHKEHELRDTFELRQKRASQLPQYVAQLADMKHSFSELLRQLPSDTEIPGLILDISEKGLSNGLELELFEPRDEVQMGFYAEKPIKIIAKGSYQQLASFVSDLSGLPRIVTINNINLAREEKSEHLRMEATVKTFHYLDDAPPAGAGAGAAKPAAKGATPDKPGAGAAKPATKGKAG